MSPPNSEEEEIRKPRPRKYWEKLEFMRSTLTNIGAMLPQDEVLGECSMPWFAGL